MVKLMTDKDDFLSPSSFVGHVCQSRENCWEFVLLNEILGNAVDMVADVSVFLACDACFGIVGDPVLHCLAEVFAWQGEVACGVYSVAELCDYWCVIALGWFVF